MKRLEYFLNAVLYCLWRMRVTFNKVIDVITYHFMICILYILPRKVRLKMEENRANNLPVVNRLRYNKKNGLCISSASTLMGALLCSFMFLPSGIVLGCFVNITGLNYISVGAALIITVVTATMIEEKFLFKKYKYLKYFKQFDKKDAKWYRRWRLITLIFIVISVVSVVSGFLFFASRAYHYGLEFTSLPTFLSK